MKPALWTARTVGLWTLACLPVALSVVVHGAATPAPLSISAVSRPALAFNQYQVDLGAIQAMPEVRATFVFRNRGSQPVEIQEVSPSCGCLMPRLTKKRYEPGESDGLVVRVQPANEKPGAQEYFVDLKYTDPEPRSVRLTFKLVIPEKQLLVSPKALIFFQFSNQETTQELLVTNARGTSLRILDAVTNSSYVTVRVGEQRQARDGAPQQVIHVTAAGNVPDGRHHGLITVKTDDPDQPELRVPVMVQGGKAPKTP